MQTKEKRTATFFAVAAMLVFGTVGLFRRAIPIPSDALAFSRGIIGALFLFLWQKCRGHRFETEAVRKNWKKLVLSGSMIGINWILLFEAYNHTTVAIATLCYYFQPVIVMLLSPLLLKERLSLKKGICILVSVAGMIFVSGVMQGHPSQTGFDGVLLGTAAAVFYAGVILTNKMTKGVPVYEKSITQLVSASVILIPYMIATGSFSAYQMGARQIMLLIIVGILHTGIAYALYFFAIERLPAQSSAILSYIDPVTAVLLSALFLKERIDVFTVIGAFLILGAAIASEMDAGRQDGR